MKLYYSKGACSLAVRIVINELNIACDYESVDLKTKQTETNENFLLINPKGAVPVIKLDNNDVLTENAVIQQYLADENNATQLLPEIKNINRYHVLEWLNYITTELHKGFGPFFNPVFTTEMKENIFKPMLLKKFEYVNEQLGNKEYIASDNFTLPDAYLFVILTWAVNLKFDFSKLTNLSAYFQTLKQRESIIKSLKEEGLAN